MSCTPSTFRPSSFTCKGCGKIVPYSFPAFFGAASGALYELKCPECGVVNSVQAAGPPEVLDDAALERLGSDFEDQCQ